ncbi:hypothetical protein OG984_12005 [Nocardioides sp. NBC_00368]|uniref:hypothetical protein n=1 Tax=Nocardioides sp. NBC_00368 TaxID=2976000 RepID=UPI002E2344D6
MTMQVAIFRLPAMEEATDAAAECGLGVRLLGQVRGAAPESGSSTRATVFWR